MSITDFQLKSALQEHLKSGRSAEATAAIEELRKMGHKDISITHTTVRSPVDLTVGALESLSFRDCHFKELIIKDGSIKDVNFINCHFNDKVEFNDVSILSKISFHQVKSKIPHLFFKGVNSKPELRLITISFEQDRTNLENFTLENASIKFTLLNTIAPDDKLMMSNCDFFGDFSQFFSFKPSMQWTILNCTFEEKFNNTGDRSIKSPLQIKGSTFKKGLALTGINFHENLLIEDCSVHASGLVMQNCNLPHGADISGKFSSLEISGGRVGGTVKITGDKNFLTDTIRIGRQDTNFARLELHNIKVKYLFLLRKDNQANGINLQSLKLNEVNILQTFAMEVSIDDQMEVTNSIFKYSKFVSCKFSGPTHFKKTKFGVAPLFDHCEMFFDTSFKTSKFLDKSSNSEGAYRQLKHKMSIINNDVEEGRFASYEIIARMKGLGITDWFEFMMSFFYYIINRCGNSLLQPFILIFALCYFFSFIYTDPGSILFSIPKEIKETGPTWHSIVEKWDYIHQAYAYSAINSTGPLRLLFPSGIFIPMTPQIFFWSFIQVTFSSILWFFLISGIRKRFKVN